MPSDSPSRASLFNEIVSFVQGRLAGEEPASKRRRLDGGGAPAAAAVKREGGETGRPESLDAADPGSEPVLLEVKEISVSVPQRKKYDLCFTADHLYARAPGTAGPVPGLAYRWRDVGTGTIYDPQSGEGAPPTPVR